MNTYKRIVIKYFNFFMFTRKNEIIKYNDPLFAASCKYIYRLD